MNNDRRRFVDVPMNSMPGKTHNRVEVYYDEGGPNYFTGAYKKRGYHFLIAPIAKGDNSVTYTAFSGKGTVVKEANRYSAKDLKALAETLLPHAAEFSDLFGEDDGAQIIAKLKGLTEHG